MISRKKKIAPKTAPKIAIVACEESADYLGGMVMREIKNIMPAASFFGVGGDLMQEQGLRSIIKMEELTAVGLIEIIKDIPRILRHRKNLAQAIVDEKADILIGIDSPDFNLQLENNIRNQGIKTIQLISPTIWAWRPNRVKAVAKAVDALLCSFPFETDLYDKYAEKNPQAKVNAIYIGHPMADEIDLKNDKLAARKLLNLAGKPQQKTKEISPKYIALLPGSRTMEIERLTGLFIDTARILLDEDNHRHFLFAAINEKAAARIEQELASKDFPKDKYDVFSRKTRTILKAADAVLVASGTASLETMLVKRPMVVAYKASLITEIILRIMVITEYIALPNILFNKLIVPEFYQRQANKKILSRALSAELKRDFTEQSKLYSQMHKKLRCNAAVAAAKSIIKLIPSS